METFQQNTQVSDHSIQLVMTQTNYTKNEAINKLSEFNNDAIKVIKDFMGLNNNIDTTSKTGSQERYRLIREVIYHDNHNKNLKNQ